MEDLTETISKDPHLGPWPFVDTIGVEPYSEEELDIIRNYEGGDESIIQLFGELDDKAAQLLSDNKNATVSWFDETLPEASDVTNKMAARAVCATAIYRWKEKVKLL